MNKYIPYLIILAIGVLIGGGMCKTCTDRFRNDVVIVEKPDTIVLRDTIKEYYPKETVTERTEYIRVEVRDTIREKDTLYINLPLEKRAYKREDFYAEVCGYDPRLTYIEVYPKTQVITQTETVAKRTKQHSLSVGMEVNYSTYASFPVQLEYAYNVKSWLNVYGYTEYELLRRQVGIGIGTKMQISW